MLLRIVHSVEKRKIRSAGFDVFICAVSSVEVPLGFMTDVRLAANVALSDGRVDAASAPKLRLMSMSAATVRTASSATTDMRRAVTTPVIGESPPGISYPP